jgi:murein tripeptide amidase MpaA
MPKGNLFGFDFGMDAKADGPLPLGTTVYHSYNETVGELVQISIDHPDITKLVSIGRSFEGRDIWAMKVSDNPDIEEDEPEVFYFGNHHAREWLTIGISKRMNLKYSILEITMQGSG